jgi:hypothetical protein
MLEHSILANLVFWHVQLVGPGTCRNKDKVLRLKMSLQMDLIIFELEQEALSNQINSSQESHQARCGNRQKYYSIVTVAVTVVGTNLYRDNTFY